MSTESLKCARCRQPLPQGSGFCVSCGHNNDTALIKKSLKVAGEAEKRLTWAQRLSAWLWGERD
ncbi:MAG TPA: hypothetical protein VGI40_08475 [Pirellulaceae bacterium]|jgi:hypothetical protein